MRPRPCRAQRGRRVRGCRGDWNATWRPEGSGAGPGPALARQPRHRRDGAEGTSASLTTTSSVMTTLTPFHWYLNFWP
nr:uncharacterized protein LOC105759344 [Taeniopygia guttata]